MAEPDYPPTAFHFIVQIDGTDDPCAFQEVSGIGPDIEHSTEGSEHQFVHNLPKVVKHRDLVLKRGVATEASSLILWCRDLLDSGLASSLETKTVDVHLVSETGERLRGWSFANAYPVKWEIGAFNARTPLLAIESITLRYSYLNDIGPRNESTGQEKK